MVCMNNDLTTTLICAGILLASAAVLFIICLNRRRHGKKAVVFGVISAVLLAGAIAAAVIPLLLPGEGIRLKKSTAGINSIASVCDDMGAMLESKRLPKDARLERGDARLYNMQIDLTNGAVDCILARIDCSESGKLFTRAYQLNGDGTGFVQGKIERTVEAETVSLAELKHVLKKLDDSKWLSTIFCANGHLNVKYTDTATEAVAGNNVYLLDDTGIRELNDGKSVEGKFYEFLLYVEYNNDTNETPSARLYIAAE